MSSIVNTRTAMLYYNYFKMSLLGFPSIVYWGWANLWTCFDKLGTFGEVCNQLQRQVAGAISARN